MKYYVASWLLFLGFAILGTLIITNNTDLYKWDLSSFHLINNPTNQSVNNIMIFFTHYGREAVWIGVTAILFIFGKQDGRKTAILLTVAFLILIPLGTLLKDEFNRSRPMPLSYYDLLVKETDSSFPSGHAVIVSAGAFIMLARFNQGRHLAISLILALEAFLVIYSRIYVGDHYPIDVIAGTLLGTGVASVVIDSEKFIFPFFLRLGLLGKKSV